MSNEVDDILTEFGAVNQSPDHHRVVECLQVECGPSRGVSISCARGQHTNGPVACSAAICHTIDRDVLNVVATGLLSNFSQRAPT